MITKKNRVYDMAEANQRFKIFEDCIISDCCYRTFNNCMFKYFVIDFAIKTKFTSCIIGSNYSNLSTFSNGRLQYTINEKNYQLYLYDWSKALFNRSTFGIIKDDNISYVIFMQSNFNQCHFKSLEFKECDFSYCNFTKCIMKNVSFHNCKFDKATFKQCNIRGVSFVNCNFSCAVFYDNDAKLKLVEGCNIDERNIEEINKCTKNFNNNK